MPRNQITYQSLGLYVGPAPSSGYHFITPDGVLTNSSVDYSLIFPLHRVQASSFSINPNRTNISHLGDLGTISRPTLNDADVNLSFQYYLMGLVNCRRLGLMCNIPKFDTQTGDLLYGTGRVSVISGFYTRDTSIATESEWFYPLNTKEPRNIFIASKKDNFDYNDTIEGDYRENVDVYGFGDCYMTNYNLSAGITAIPSVSVNYICNNIELNSSGIDCHIPSINKQSYNIHSGIKFSIPNNFEGTGLPTVLIPSDITLSIKQRSNNSENLTDLFLDFNDIKIQNFEFNMELNRTPLYAIGYKYPLDRIIQFPVISNLSFSLLPGDNKAGSMVSLIKRNENYDISIKLNYQRKQSFSGTAIQYDFLGAKFEGFEDSINISQRRNNSLNFTIDIDPLKIDKGFFMSGYLGIPTRTISGTYLVDDFPDADLILDNLLTEDGDLFALTLGKHKLFYA